MILHCSAYRLKYNKRHMHASIPHRVIIYAITLCEISWSTLFSPVGSIVSTDTRSSISNTGVSHSVVVYLAVLIVAVAGIGWRIGVVRKVG